MRLRIAISLLAALLLGLQGPACLALCSAAGETSAERVQETTAPPCHAEATPPASSHPEPEPLDECPDDCPGCAGEAPLLSAGLKDASAAAPLLIAPAPFAMPRALEATRRPALQRAAWGPPPRDLLLVTSSLRL